MRFYTSHRSYPLTWILIIRTVTRTKVVASSHWVTLLKGGAMMNLFLGYSPVNNER